MRGEEGGGVLPEPRRGGARAVVIVGEGVAPVRGGGGEEAGGKAGVAEGAGVRVIEGFEEAAGALLGGVQDLAGGEDGAGGGARFLGGPVDLGPGAIGRPAAEGLADARADLLAGEEFALGIEGPGGVADEADEGAPLVGRAGGDDEQAVLTGEAGVVGDDEVGGRSGAVDGDGVVDANRGR